MRNVSARIEQPGWQTVPLSARLGLVGGYDRESLMRDGIGAKGIKRTVDGAETLVCRPVVTLS